MTGLKGGLILLGRATVPPCPMRYRLRVHWGLRVWASEGRLGLDGPYIRGVRLGLRPGLGVELGHGWVRIWVG